MLDSTIANVSVPHIAGLAVSPTRRELGDHQLAVADAISVPLTGWLAARFGTVRWFIVSIVGFGIFSFLCGISRTLDRADPVPRPAGACGRAADAAVADTAAHARRKRPVSRLAILVDDDDDGADSGADSGRADQRQLELALDFFINLPVVAVCAFGVGSMLGAFETKKAKMRIDIVGLVLLVLSVGSFQVMLDTGREHDWFGSAWIVMLAIVAAINFAAFLIWELTDANPVVNVRVFRFRGSFATVAISLGFGAFSHRSC